MKNSNSSLLLRSILDVVCTQDAWLLLKVSEATAKKTVAKTMPGEKSEKASRNRKSTTIQLGVLHGWKTVTLGWQAKQYCSEALRMDNSKILADDRDKNSER